MNEKYMTSRSDGFRKERNGMRRLLKFPAANVWLFISLLIVGVAVRFAEDTYFTKRGKTPPGIGIALTYNNGALLSEPSIILLVFGDDSLGFALSARVKPDTLLSLALGDLDEDRSCVEGRGLRKLEFIKHSYPATTYVVPSLPSEGGGVFVRCFLRSKVFHATYATRQMDFGHSYVSPPVGCPLKCEVPSYVLDFSLIPRVTHLEFIGGEPLGERRRRLKVDDLLSVSWEDEVSAQRRDLRLVLLGLIVAIAAGAFIEWVRPTIDGFRAWGRTR